MATIRNIAVRVGGDISQMTRMFRRGQAQARRFKATFDDVGSGMKDFGANLTGNLTAPIVGLGAVSVINSAKFEQSMSKVRAVTGATASDMDILGKKAREMGSRTSKSASESAEAMYYMGLAGWDNKQIMEGIEPVLRLAEAGNLDLARASDLVTDSMSALGLRTKDLNKYLDSLAKTSASSNTDIDMLSEAMIVVGGQFKNLKTPIAESSALLGVLANRGIKASEAGTSLNSILINLTSGAGQAGDAMESINLKAFDTQGKFKGISVVLKELRDKLKGMSEEKKVEVLSKIGGKTQIDTLNALLSSVDETNGEFDQLYGKIKNSDGALMEMVKTMQSNFIGQLNILKSSLEELSLQFGEIILPYLKRFTEFISELVTKLNLVPTPIKEIILAFSLVTATIPVLITGLGILITSFTAVAGVIGAINAPVVLLISGIIGVGVAVGAFINFLKNAYNENENFKKAVQSLANAIKTRFEQIKIKVDEIKNKFIDFYKKNESAINSFKEKFIEVLTSVAKLIGSFISGDLEQFKKDASKLFSSIFKLWQSSQKELNPILNKLLDKVVRALGKLVIEGIKYAGKFIMAFIGELDKKARNISATMERKIVESIKSDLDKLKTIALSAGKILVSYLIDGINSKISKLKQEVNKLTGMISDFFPRSPAKRGALREIPKWGKKIMTQLTYGITDNQKIVTKAIDNVTSQMEFGNISLKKNTAKHMMEQFKQIENTARNATRKGTEIRQYMKQISTLLEEKKGKNVTATRIKEIDNEIKKAEFYIKHLEIEARDNFIKKFAEDSQKYLQEFGESLKANIQTIMSRTQQVFNQLSLFEKAQTKSMSSAKLQKNLDSQVAVMEDYVKSLNMFENKTKDEAFIDYFRKMGIGAVNEIKALNKMTQEEFNKYVETFNKKMDISEEIAVSQLQTEGKAESRIEQVVFNITGNTITNEDDIERITNAIGYQLKIAGI